MAQNDPFPTDTGPSNVTYLDDYQAAPSVDNIRQYGGGTGSGSGGGSSVDSETKNYVDKSMESVKAQNDARFSEVGAKLDVLSSKIDSLPTPVGFWQMAGMAATAIVALVTILGIMSDRFDGGIAATSVVDNAVSRIENGMSKRDIEQAERDAEQDARFGLVLDALKKLNTAPQSTEENQN